MKHRPCQEDGASFSVYLVYKAKVDIRPIHLKRIIYYFDAICRYKQAYISRKKKYYSNVLVFTRFC